MSRAKKEDTVEKPYLSMQNIPISGEIGELDLTVGKRDSEELSRYGCIVLRCHNKKIVAMVPTWVVRYRDSMAIAMAQYGRCSSNQHVLNSLNQVAREITKRRKEEGDFGGIFLDGWQLLGVNPTRVNEILRSTDVTYKRYLKDARRLSLWEQEGKCVICHGRIEIDEETHDHWWPRSSGGRNDWNNMRVAHPKCNRDKGDILPPGLTANDPSFPPLKRRVSGLWVLG